MSHFLKGSYDGAAVSTAHVKSSCLGFCGRSYYVLERLAKDIDGSVDAVRVINPSEVVMDGDVAENFGFHEVSGVRRDLEDRAAGVEANDGFGICVEVVHEPVFLSVVSVVSLDCSDPISLRATSMQWSTWL